MPIRTATSSDIHAWISLRTELWGDTSLDQHRDEVTKMLARPADQCAVFLDIANESEIRGFAEATLRHDYVNGCNTSPVAFLEGIFVRSQDRGSGIGRLLLRSVQSWAQDQGCTELASDAELCNLPSFRFHMAMGFEETERVVFFRKPI
ncbi:MAG: aminoglycoside 6'-N-acetyltransferase [Pseudomonadota bacterium]